jgi:hypothetical protein
MESKLAVPLTVKLIPPTVITAESDIVTSVFAAKTAKGKSSRDRKIVK